jgi:hypothetical protein
MVSNQKEAIPNFIQALTQLKTFNQETPNSMFVQFFMQNKIAELTGIFKLGTMEDKAKAIEILSNLDPSNTGKYNEELK